MGVKSNSDEGTQDNETTDPNDEDASEEDIQEKCKEERQQRKFEDEADCYDKICKSIATTDERGIVKREVSEDGKD